MRRRRRGSPDGWNLPSRPGVLQSTAQTADDIHPGLGGVHRAAQPPKEAQTMHRQSVSTGALRRAQIALMTAFAAAILAVLVLGVRGLGQDSAAAATRHHVKHHTRHHRGASPRWARRRDSGRPAVCCPGTS